MACRGKGATVNKNQARTIVRMLNSGWPQRPLTEETSTLWAGLIMGLDFKACHGAVRSLTATAKFRPSLAEVMELANLKPKRETASEAFQSVLASLAYGRNSRAKRISERASAAVRALGGWGVVGTWQVSSMSFHQRDFTRVFEDVTDRADDDRRLGLPARSMPAISQGEPNRPATGPRRAASFDIDACLRGFDDLLTSGARSETKGPTDGDS